MMDTEKYNVILPGRIVTYDPVSQQATIQVCVERSYNDSGQTGDVVTRVPLEYVPVHTPGGGNWHMTFPIKPGDTCVLFFSQAGYDHWLWEDRDTAGTLAGLVKPDVRRKFHEDDGFAFVGMNTLPRAIADYNATDSEWRNVDREQRISLQESGTIEIVTGTTSMVLSPNGTITVNSDTSVSITSPQQTITATTKVDIVSPLVTMSGNLQVAGAIGGGGAAPTSGINMTGGGTFSEDVEAGGVSVSTHEHAGDGGSGSGPTTGPPL